MRARDLDAKVAFDRLVEMGCPRWLLEATCDQLRVAARAVSKRKKRQAPRKEPEPIKKKASAVDDAVNRTSEAVTSLSSEPGVFDTLPELRPLLVAIASWKGAMLRLKGEHEPAVNHARARLIDVVALHTKGWHDNEVSLLVSDALDNPKIDRIVQQQWRIKHRELLTWTNLARGEEVLQGIGAAIANMNRTAASRGKR